MLIYKKYINKYSLTAFFSQQKQNNKQQFNQDSMRKCFSLFVWSEVINRLCHGAPLQAKTTTKT